MPPTSADRSAAPNVWSRLDQLVAATPPSRDRYIDFLRAASIVAVVFGHWIIGIVDWGDGVIVVRSAVGLTPWMWLGTWFLQVMPVFFFVGGYANAVALRRARERGAGTVWFLRTRIGRLLRPSVVFVAFWAVVQVVMHVADAGAPTSPRFGGFVVLRGVRPPGQTLPFGPLWFLAVYAAVVVLSPATIALHRRFGWWVPAAFCAGAVAADLIGFVGGHPGARWANVAFVLLLPHQLGHAYADGSLVALSRRVYWAMVAVGLGGLVALTNPLLFTPFGERRFAWFPGIGHYPRSLLGTGVEQVSNAHPPTLCYLFAGIWTVGGVMLLRPPLTRWLGRRGPWKATIAVNLRVMTIFLWHMTAYLVAIVLLWPLHLGREQTPSVRWWLERVVWLAVPAMVLVGITAVVGRFERAPRRAAT